MFGEKRLAGISPGVRSLPRREDIERYGQLIVGLLAIIATALVILIVQR